jgi:hypothetical protein
VPREDDRLADGFPDEVAFRHEPIVTKSARLSRKGYMVQDRISR